MRLLHTMLRVGNLEQSLNFYTEVLGMKLLRQKDIPKADSRSPSWATAKKSDSTVWN